MEDKAILPHLLLIVESGVDVRTVQELSRRCRLTILVRDAFGQRNITWPCEGEGPAEVLRGPAGRVAFAAHVLRWLVGHRSAYDAVLVQNYGMAALAANLARLITRVATILLILSPTIEYFRCKRRKGKIALPAYLLGMAVLKACRLGNALLAQRYAVVSHYLATVVGPGGQARSTVIPFYGVDTRYYHPAGPGQKTALRARLGLPPETYLIMFSSRVVPEKDTECLLRAAVLLRKQGRDFRILNLSGGYEEFLREADALQIRDRVEAREAVHPLRELPAYYQAADLCVQVSVEEGLGISPLEALACDVPVIATAVGGLREIIREGETGLTVPAGHAQALADRIAYAMDHPAEMAAMALRGRKMVEEGFEAERCFDALVDLAQSLSAGNRARSLAQGGVS